MGIGGQSSAVAWQVVKMGLRRRPYAFTEQGVAMLPSVLKSDRAERKPRENRDDLDSCQVLCQYRHQA